MMPMSLDAAAAGLATARYSALDPDILASTTTGVSYAQQLGSSAASLAAAMNLAGARIAGSAPAGYSLLQGSDITAAGLQQQQQQQLICQLQLEQRQLQLHQQQALNDQLLLQQLLVQQQQQQAALAVSTGKVDLQQLVQQQQQAFHQLQLSQLQQQQAALQQSTQQWPSSSLLNPQPAAAGPRSQLLWQQQHLNHNQQHLDAQCNPGSLRSSGSLTPPDDNQLAAAVSAGSGAGSLAIGSAAQVLKSAQLAGAYQAAGPLTAGQQSNGLKWSSSILSKQVQPVQVSAPLQLLAQASAEA